LKFKLHARLTGFREDAKISAPIERDKYSYPIENREEVRDGHEVQKEVSQKVPLRTSLGGEEQGALRIESVR